MAIAALIWLLAHFIYPQKIDGLGLLLIKGEVGQVLSPTSGTISAWLLDEGSQIKAGDVLALIQDYSSSANLHKVLSHSEGFVAEIIAYPNTAVKRGQALAIITSAGDPRRDLELVGFVSALKGKKIRPGMKAIIDPTVTDPYTEGHLTAVVKRVGRLPMTKAAIQSVVKIPEVAKYIRGQLEAEPFVVVLNLVADEQHITGYRWTGRGPSFVLDSGVFGSFQVIYDEPSLLALLWPSFFRSPRAK